MLEVTPPVNMLISLQRFHYGVLIHVATDGLFSHLFFRCCHRELKASCELRWDTVRP